jgi:hypothetical protein
MNLIYDSFHRVDFSISGGGAMESVLLRRRKLLRWNKGARFHILPGKPSHEELLKALADEEHAAQKTLAIQRQQSKAGPPSNLQQSSPASPPQNNNNNNNNNGSTPGAEQDDPAAVKAAAVKAAAVAAAAERVYSTVARVAAGKTSPHSRPSSPVQLQGTGEQSSTTSEPTVAALPFWCEELPEPWEFGELDFDLRRVAKVLGPRHTFLHVAHRLGHRFKYLRPSDIDLSVEGGLTMGAAAGPSPPLHGSNDASSSSGVDALSATSPQQQQQQQRRPSGRPTLRGEYMCDASTFGAWAEAVADSYSEANPYHNVLHAADVMLTASVIEVIHDSPFGFEVYACIEVCCCCLLLLARRCLHFEHDFQLCLYLMSNW